MLKHLSRLRTLRRAPESLQEQGNRGGSVARMEEAVRQVGTSLGVGAEGRAARPTEGGGKVGAELPRGRGKHALVQHAEPRRGGESRPVGRTLEPVNGSAEE